MKKTKKEQPKTAKLVTPRNAMDLDDIGLMLQEDEMSILVNLSQSKCNELLIEKAMQYIASFNTPYMVIRTKRIYKRVFICYSQLNPFTV